MFSTIDNPLINLFQWIIRQFELFTPITRKNIIDVNLIIIKWLLVGWAILLILFSILFPSSMLSYYLFACYPFWFIYSLTKKTYERQVQNNLLPQEILTRKDKRLICLICFLFFQLFNNWTIETRFMVIPFVSGFYFFLACVEYFLCTKPLPPGEKEKKKVEREIKNAKVQLI